MSNVQTYYIVLYQNTNIFFAAHNELFKMLQILDKNNKFVLRFFL